MLYFITYLFHCWLLHTFFQSFFPVKTQQPIKKVAIWSLFLIGQLFIGALISEPLLLFFANSCITLLLCTHLFEANRNKALFLSFASCSIGMIVEIAVAFTLEFFGHSQYETVLVGAILSKLVLLFLVHAITLFQYQNPKNSSSWVYWLLLCSITVASIICIYILFFFIQESGVVLLEKLSLTCIFLLFFINLSFFVFNNQLEYATSVELENVVISQQIKHYKELRDTREEQITLFHREKHNLKNQLLAIRAYAKANDTSAIIVFINKLLNDTDFGLTTYSASNNLIFDTIICSKIKLAGRHQITYTWNIQVPDTLPFEDVDLCILIGNALDNAFDACLADPTLPNRYIHIEAKYTLSCLYLSFENPFSHTLKQSSGKSVFQTTKPDTVSHGFGMPSLQSIVDKYHGTLSVDHADQVFTLKILLYSE